MFEPHNSFTMPQTPRTERFVATWARSAFRPWMSDDEALDEDDGDVSMTSHATEQLQAEAFAEGLRQGEAIANDAAAIAVIEAAARIAAAADRFEPCCDNVIAALLAETVTTLMREMFEADVANPDHLQRRARQLARMIRDDVDPTCLRLHPEDAARLADTALPWPMTADSTLERGEIRLETKEGGITDNPADRIERLRCRIAGEAAR